MIQPDVNIFINDLKKEYSSEEVALIEKAYHFAEEAHQGQKRASGDPYFSHCLAVTLLLIEMEMDSASICAGLLHDILEDTAVTFNLLKGEFPEPIPQLVQGVTKISTIKFRSKMEKQAENLRRMMLAMAKDIRVIIIKFCDRLHNMRTLQYLPEQKQILIAQDTLEIYAPLANRLGMTRIRSELEDLAMKYIYPEDYQELREKTNLRDPKRFALIERTKKILETELDKRHIKAEIEGRTKHLFGIFQKMRRQNITFEEIYDLTALRIIADSIELCYDILGLVHTLWRPIPNRFRDYIALPKENQYQSLHTTVMGLDGEAMEIQIRTHNMHRIAEEGIAAHWKYKEGIKSLTDIDDLRLQWLRQLIEWLKDIRNPDDFIDALKEDVFADIVFCFTPKGDVVELPKGSTPLDFAYHIHTEVGNSSIGARVNKKYVSLKTSLHSGDVVEIITSNHAHPSRDWIDLVKTSRARSKIKHYLKTKEFHQYIKIGHDLLQKALKIKGLSLSHPAFQDKLELVIKGSRVNSLDDLLFEIGFGSVSANDIAARFGQEVAKPKKKKKKKALTPGIIMHGMDNTLVRYSKCCNPLPGDPIIGFITRGRGISIHKDNCPALLRQKIDNSSDSSRIVQVEWDRENLPKRRVNIRVVARDRTGLLKDLSGTISQMGLNVEESHSRVVQQKSQAIFRFTVYIDDTKQLNDLLNRVKNVPGVMSLSRIVRKQENQEGSE